MHYLAERKVDAEALISKHLPLEQWQEAFEQMETFAGIRFVFDLGSQ